MDDRSIAFARGLEERDATLAAAISDVDDLQRATEDVRRRADEVAASLAAVPGRREIAAAAVERARDELEARRPGVVRAERELEDSERSGDADRREAARRALERARDTLALAEHRLARAQDEVADVDRDEQEARAEATALEERARALSEQVQAHPRVSRQGAEPPRHGLDGTIAWASQARAALWVVRSGLDDERERVVREANELGASVLGEPLAATSVAAVRERLERAAS
jgi:chromosome segregation ATPase